MTFVSSAEACRRLGIDAKTLRRWLDDAQLPLQDHPRDGRKKGMSGEHLERLARLHHRRLAPLSLEPPAPVQFLDPLPETVRSLQTQISVLQQQIADLTLLLQQHMPPPASPAVPTKPRGTSKHFPKPASPAPRSRSSAKAPPKPVHVIPRVEYGPEGRYVVICPKRGLLPFEPETPQWFAWVATQSSFRFVGRSGHFTAHHEWTTPRGAWRAHRQIRNHSYNLPLAPNQNLTIAVLEQAAAALQVHLTTP